MATYYVRKTGNDGNTGLEPTAQAWLTIDHAANQVGVADTVWIGSGVYRELVTMDTAGTSGNQISFIGDIDGVETGDPGPVIISAFDSETGDAQRDYCVDMDEKEFIVWQYVIMDGGELACIGDVDATADLAYEGCELLDCAFLAGDNVADLSASINVNEGATPAGNGLQVKRCSFTNSFFISFDPNEVADVNLKWDIENCLLIAGGGGTQYGIWFNGSAGGTFAPGGVDIVNCTMMGPAHMVNIASGRNTVNPIRVLNCRGSGIVSFARESISTDDCIAVGKCYATVSTAIGSGDVLYLGGSDLSTSGFAVGGVADLMFYNKLGWSPWKPWEPMSLLDGTYKEPSIDAGSAAYAPANDVYGNVRPMGRINADDIGAVEARIRPEEDTVAADTVAALKGAGYLDMMAAVDAALTTFTVVGRYDGNYAGNLPIFRILEIPGVADQSDVMVAAANTDETLSIAFTPTSAGYVRLRLESRDTSANGEAYFKDLVPA